MKAFLLVNPGLEKLTLQEISELIKIKGKKFKEVIEFNIKDKKEYDFLTKKIRSARRLLFSLGKTKELDKFEFKKTRELSELLSPWYPKSSQPSKFSFKIEVEGVKGQENRLEIARKIGGKFFKALEKKHKAEIELKKPDLLLVVYFNGEEYFLGLDFSVKELNLRDYRVFVNQAGFKGDLSYYFFRGSGFIKGEKLLVGFVKDGTILIEGILFSSEKIWGFDNNHQNIIAAKKNAKLAGVSNLIDLSKFELDELDIRFSEGELDRIIFQVTKKDEAQLNEIYYQAGYILRKGGRLMLIGRENWEISVSENFKLISSEVIKKGESGWRIWLLEKKQSKNKHFKN